MGFTLEKAINVYAIIGLIGIFSMPIMGKVADKVVQVMGDEVKGRKLMLLVGPATGAIASLLLLATARGDVFAYLACFVFAVYWAIVPGGVVGYVGAIYGRKTLGKIWGLATMIVMGIGPFLGTYIGASLKDLSGSYTYSIALLRSRRPSGRDSTLPGRREAAFALPSETRRAGVILRTWNRPQVRRRSPWWLSRGYIDRCKDL